MSGPTRGADDARQSQHPSPRAARKWWRHAPRYGCSWLRRAPFTAAFVTGLWAVAIATGSVGHGPGDGLDARVALGVRPLTHGHWWAPLSSMAFCGSLAGYVLTTILVVAVCVPAEGRLGSRRTAAAFVASHLLGGLVGTGLAAAGWLVGEGWSDAIADATAVGPSTGAVGVALTLSSRCSPLWRRRLRVTVLVALGTLVLYSGGLQDMLRLAAGVAGLLLGPVLAGRPQPARAVAVSRPKARRLLALIVTAAAVGPLVAVVSGVAVGPLSVLRYLFLPSVPDPARLSEACESGTRALSCQVELMQVRAHRLAPTFASIVTILVKN